MYLILVMGKTLIQCLLFVLDNRPTKGFVLIPSTAVNEHSNVCQLFTRNNVQILNNNEDYPSLREALERGQAEVLELIATSRLNEKVYSFTSETTPFIPIAVETGNEELIKQIFGKDAAVYENCIDPRAEFETINDENLEIIERLLMSGIDIRCMNPLGGTLLHFAVRKHEQTLLQLLLKHTINIDAVSNDGSTALHFAVNEDNSPIASLLLEKGVAVNARRKDGSTSLLSAAGRNQLLMVRLLLKNGANVNIGNHDGLTPLHAASKDGNPAVANVLLEQGANVNAVVTYHHAKGVTPLSSAIEEKHLEVIECLLKNGADPSIPCYNDQTVLKLAVDSECVQIVECILKHHPDLNTKTKKQLSFCIKF